MGPLDADALDQRFREETPKEAFSQTILARVWSLLKKLPGKCVKFIDVKNLSLASTQEKISHGYSLLNSHSGIQRGSGVADIVPQAHSDDGRRG